MPQSALVRKSSSSVDGLTLPSSDRHDGLVSPGYQFGRYRVEECLGHGGMGAVYRAFDPVLGRRIALKTMLSQTFEDMTIGLRFLREAEVTAKLSHPNIVSLYDLGMQHGAPYLVLELLQGELLETHLEREQRLSPAQTFEIFLPLLSAMHHAHTLGVVHLDLKPANVFLTQSSTNGEQPKLLDFGVCGLSDLDQELDPTYGEHVGTPIYMAPERFTGQPVSQPADQFSLGVMLYESLSGNNPFSRRSTVSEVKRAVLTQDYPLLSELCVDVSRELGEVVHRALEPQPELRFQNIQAFARALLAFATSEQRAYWGRVFEAGDG